MIVGTLPWELLGAVVGAGMASGREIASFFGRYGAWGCVGAALASAMMYLLGGATMPQSWRRRWPERLWRVLLTLLLIATAGAMLAASAEVAALVLPVHGAYWLGMAGTFLLAWVLARRTVNGLAWVSRAMMLVLAVLVLLGLTIDPMRAVALTDASVPMALLRGVTYGGFNAALMYPVMAASGQPPARKRQGRLLGCIGIALLLMLGNAVLLRHPALIGEPLPYIRLMAQLGQLGYALGALALYLAILSTLTVCLRALGEMRLCVCGALLTALCGFSGVVDRGYPLLGGACALMLLAMRIAARRKGRK